MNLSKKNNNSNIRKNVTVRIPKWLYEQIKKKSGGSTLQHIGAGLFRLYATDDRLQVPENESVGMILE